MFSKFGHCDFCDFLLQKTRGKIPAIDLLSVSFDDVTLKVSGTRKLAFYSHAPVKIAGPSSDCTSRWKTDMNLKPC